MKIKGPKKFSFPLLKLSDAEVEIMANAWLKSTKHESLILSLVEEALIYGAQINPDQSFRVIQKICRKTNNQSILKMVAVNLLEDLMAFSAKKIKRKLYLEYKINKSFKMAFSFVYLTPKDKGYSVVKPFIKEFSYL